MEERFKEKLVIALVDNIDEIKKLEITITDCLVYEKYFAKLIDTVEKEYNKELRR